MAWRVARRHARAAGEFRRPLPQQDSDGAQASDGAHATRVERPIAASRGDARAAGRLPGESRSRSEISEISGEAAGETGTAHGKSASESAGARPGPGGRGGGVDLDGGDALRLRELELDPVALARRRPPPPGAVAAPRAGEARGAVAARGDAAGVLRERRGEARAAGESGRARGCVEERGRAGRKGRVVAAAAAVVPVGVCQPARAEDLGRRRSKWSKAGPDMA
jgi:hypothetical protein